MKMRMQLLAVVALLCGCAEPPTSPRTAATPTLDVLYSRIRAAGQQSQRKYRTLAATSQGCLFGATHVDSTFQGLSVPRMLLPFELPPVSRHRGTAGRNQVAKFTLQVPGKGGVISVACIVASKGLAEATLASVRIDPANPKWHMILVGLAQRERHQSVAVPYVSDEVSTVRREVLGYEASEKLEAAQALAARETATRPILAAADCMQEQRNVPNARLLGVQVPMVSPQVIVPAPPSRGAWTCSPGDGENWMDVQVDAVGTWAAAWDYYDFAGLELDNQATPFTDALGPYYGDEPDMSVDAMWGIWSDQPYYDPTYMPVADDQDAAIASALICGSKCLTPEEFEHNGHVSGMLQALYDESMSDPIHREYGAYLYRDPQNHIQMGAIFIGVPGSVYMGDPPPGSIAAMHTHPTSLGGVVGWGDIDSPGQSLIDGQDQSLYDTLHEIGVIITQHRELYYRPAYGDHPSLTLPMQWAAYPPAT